jgi:hypothetical protein
MNTKPNSPRPVRESIPDRSVKVSHLSIVCSQFLVTTFSILFLSISAQGAMTLLETGGSFGPGDIATNGTPFGLNEEGAPFGQISKVNDGIYGNASSWVGTTSPTFIGIRLNGTNTIDRIAFGRDNTTNLTDRFSGTYTVQFTTVPSPNENTDDTNWTTIDVLDYATSPPPSPALRHLYQFPPVNVTGIRIITEPFGLNIAIDEIEVYSALQLVQTQGTFAAGNLAQTPGGTAFGLNEEGAPFGQIAKVNDGAYGNSSAWVGTSANSFIGINLNGSKLISKVAFGRDNTGSAMDRYAGQYTIEYTTVPNPDKNTPDSSWTTIGVLDYSTSPPPSPSYRHLYEFYPVTATGLRIKTASSVLNIAIDEIEIYGPGVTSTPPIISNFQPTNGALFAVASAGLRFDVTSTNTGVAASGIKLILNGTDVSGSLVITGNNTNRHATFSGLQTNQCYTAQVSATDLVGNSVTNTISFRTFIRSPLTLAETGGTIAPDDIALAPDGTAFGLNEEGAPFGQIAKVNDGTYGNSSSWVGTTVPTYIGVSFSSVKLINKIAFSRDNTGTLTDRNAGLYTIQYTTVPSPGVNTPDCSWIPLDILDYINAAPPTPWLRHVYSFTPVSATGIRIITQRPDGGLNIAMDELEVYDLPTAPIVVSAERDFSVVTTVTVRFSQPLLESTATNINNYTLNNGGSVTGAILNSDAKTVVLTTSPIGIGGTNILTINNVQESRSSIAIAPNTQAIIGVPASDVIRREYSLGGTNDVVVLEAEHFNQKTVAGGHSWIFTTSPPLLQPGDTNTVYSGDGTMLADPNTGSNLGTPALGTVPANAPRLDFKVLFTNTQSFNVWIRGVGDSAPGAGANDSVFIGLDGLLTTRITGFPAGQGYYWGNTPIGDSGPISVGAPGEHVINVWMREDGFAVDKILLTSSASYTPAGTGPTESALLAGPPITITRTSSGVTLTWSGGGTLQQSTSPSGPYINIPGATSPYPVTPTGTQNYYRVRQ